jgi:hypothetical protein
VRNRTFPAFAIGTYVCPNGSSISRGIIITITITITIIIIITIPTLPE